MVVWLAGTLGVAWTVGPSQSVAVAALLTVFLLVVAGTRLQRVVDGGVRFRFDAPAENTESLGAGDAWRGPVWFVGVANDPTHRVDSATASHVYADLVFYGEGGNEIVTTRGCWAGDPSDERKFPPNGKAERLLVAFKETLDPYSYAVGQPELDDADDIWATPKRCERRLESPRQFCRIALKGVGVSDQSNTVQWLEVRNVDEAFVTGMHLDVVKCDPPDWAVPHTQRRSIWKWFRRD